MSAARPRDRPAGDRRAAALRSAQSSRHSSPSSLTGGKKEAAVILDSDGHFVQVNRLAAMLLGYSRADLSGQPFADLLTAGSRPAWNALLARLQSGESEVREALILQRADGTETHIEFVGHPECNRHQCVAVRGTLRRLAEADRSVDYWQEIFDSLHSPAYLVDGQGIIHHANSASSWLGCPRDKIVGRSLFEFFSAPSTVLLATIKKGQTGLLETEAIRHHVRPVPVSLSYSRLGHRDEYVVMVHDLSQRTTLQDSLRRHQAALEAICAVTAPASLDVNAVLQVALNEAICITGASRGVAFIINRDTGYFEPRALQGLSKRAARQIQSTPPQLTQGLNSRAYRSRQIVLCDNVRDSPDYVALTPANRVLSELVIPLVRSRSPSKENGPLSGEVNVLGTIVLQSSRLAAFTAVDVSLMQAMADQIAIAVENAQLYQETLRRAEGLAALNAVASAVSQSLDLEATLHMALDKALEVIGVEAGAITLVNETADELVMRAHRGWRRPDLAERIRIALNTGLSGQAIATGKPIVTGDVTGDPRLAVPEFAEEGVQAMVLAPMHSRGKVVGVLSAMSYQPRTFAPHEVTLLTAIADQVGIAIDNARLYKAQSRRSVHLALINEVARQATSTLDLSDLLYRTAEAISKSFGYFHVALYLLDSLRGEAVLHAHVGGHSEAEIPGYRQTMNMGMIGYVARQGKTLVANDVTQEPHYVCGLPHYEAVAAELSVPITHGGQVIGVLDVQHLEPGAFDPDDVQAMETLAVQIGIAIQNARLFEETRQRVAELTALQEIGQQISASLDIWTVLDTIAQNGLKLVRADDAHIFLYDAQKDEFVFGTALWKNGSRTPLVTRPRSDGITARTIRSAEPIVVNDAQTHPLYASRPDWGVQAIAGFPLRRADRPLGVFTIAFLTPHTFTAEELRVLTLLADRAASALDNARMYEEIRRQLDELSVLHQVALAATSTPELAGVMERIVKALHRSLGFEYVGLFLVNETGDTLDLYAHSDTEEDLSRNLHIPLGQGITGTAAATGKPLRVGDVSTDPSYLPGIPGTLSEMAVPLKAGEGVIGVIDVQSSLFDAFSTYDERVLVTAGGQLAVIIENARLYDLERRRRQQVESLQTTAASISAELELDTLLQLVVNKAARTFDVPASSLMLWDDDGSHLVVKASHGLSPEYVESRRISREFVEDMRQGGQYVPTVIEDVASQPLDTLRPIESEGIVSALSVPLIHSGQLKGSLDLYSKGMRHKFTAEEIELAEILASQATIAIENARLYAETCRRLDELTIMAEVALAGAGELDLAQVLDRMLEAIRRTLRFETFEFILLEPVSGLLRTEAAYGLPPDNDCKELRLDEGVVGWVAQQRKPLLVSDVGRESRYYAATPRTRSELAVPLVVGDQLIGVMNVESLHANRFTEEDERLLLALAGQLALIIEKAQLHQEMRRRLDEVSTLYSFAQQLSTSLDMNQVVDSIVWSLKQVLGCRSVNIWLADPDRQVLEIHVATGVETKWKQEARLKWGEGIAGQVAATAKPIYVPDTHHVDFIFFDPVVRSLLCVPLMVRERVIGTLAVDKDVPDGFTSADERLLTIAAAQAAVAIENARLYEELKERAARLGQAYTDLQALDRLKDELVQNVSHELRTPLTFVKGYIELLLDGEMGQINEQQRESLAIVADKTNAIARLVSDILFLQQIEHQSLQLSNLNLVQVVRRALQSNQPPATAAGITLQAIAPPHLPPVRADRDRVNQVLDNLIGNAIKFSPNGGSITVQLEEANDMVQVSVSDTGIGIPPDQTERIFERFYQVDGSATRQFGGAGLGLAIVKRIVEAHGGHIWAKSQVDHGSTFLFTLPKAETS